MGGVAWSWPRFAPMESVMVSNQSWSPPAVSILTLFIVQEDLLGDAE